MLGVKLEFLGDLPANHNSYIPQFLKEEETAINLEFKKLLAKGVITTCKHEAGQ